MSLKEKIYRLLDKYEKGLELTNAEKIELTRFLEDEKYTEYVNAYYYSLWNEAEDKNFDSITNFEKIKTQIQSDSKEFEQIPKSGTLKKTPLVYQILKYAAVFIIGILITSIFYQKSNNKTETLADSNYNVIEVKYGSKSKITLPDGSFVWLNSGSKLTYPEKFHAEKREVSLIGEAYFDVVKNENKPFTVKTRELDIEVLGTSFNLKSYPEEDIVETTLIEGSVKLVRNNKGKENVFYLKPNEKASFSATENKMRIYKIPDNPKNESITESATIQSSIEKKTPIRPEMIESIISWKNQVLIFNSENIVEIAKKLERWYGYEVILKDTIPLTDTYTGKFEHNEPVTIVLDVINTTTPIEYEIEESKIIISKK